MRYAVVIEKGERNYSAYVPDLLAAYRSATRRTSEAEIRDAIEFHLEGMRRMALRSRSVERGGLCRGWRQAA